MNAEERKPPQGIKNKWLSGWRISLMNEAKHAVHASLQSLSHSLSLRPSLSPSRSTSLKPALPLSSSRSLPSLPFRLPSFSSQSAAEAALEAAE